MQPEIPTFGGGATETMLHPLVAAWMLIAVVMILVLPRQKAIIPFLLAFFTIPLAQVIVVGSLHFPVERILVLAGLARIVMSAKSSKFPGGFNRIDTVFVLWTVSALVVNSLQWMELQAFIKLSGDFLDALGGYLVARFLIPDGEAIRRTAKVLAVLCVFQGACMLGEQFT